MPARVFLCWLDLKKSAISGRELHGFQRNPLHKSWTKQRTTGRGKLVRVLAVLCTATAPAFFNVLL